MTMLTNVVMIAALASSSVDICDDCFSRQLEISSCGYIMDVTGELIGELLDQEEALTKEIDLLSKKRNALQVEYTVHLTVPDQYRDDAWRIQRLLLEYELWMVRQSIDQLIADRGAVRVELADRENEYEAARDRAADLRRLNDACDCH